MGLLYIRLRPIPKPKVPMDDASSKAQPVRLTSLAHGGGCGCKIAPGVLLLFSHTGSLS